MTVRCTDFRYNYQSFHIYIFQIIYNPLNLSLYFISLSFFQTPYYWPSQSHTPDNIEYAMYLYKRAVRNRKTHGGLEEYEIVRYKIQFYMMKYIYFASFIKFLYICYLHISYNSSLGSAQQLEEDLIK